MTLTATARPIDARRPGRLPVLQPLTTMTGKVQALGVAMLAIVVVCAVAAPVLTAHDPKAFVCEPFEAPSADHWLGCNDVGQDLLSQLFHGARVSIFVGTVVAALSTLIATILALAGLATLKLR